VQEPAVSAVWFLCVGGAVQNSMDLQRVLFAFGRRGALRWDLRKCYKISRRPLGAGGCGEVFLGQSRIKGVQGALPAEAGEDTTQELDVLTVKQTAVKLLKKNPARADEAAVKSEIDFLAQSRGHPNITALFGVFCFWGDSDSSDNSDDSDPRVPECPDLSTSQLRWGIVMELCPCGDLHDFLISNGSVSEAACLEI
ncbi:unnamed protein product, partial [Polarella glacialis]